MRGKKVCRLHGGATPAGIASPHFRTGKDSKYFRHLPATLARAFNPDDPRLIELREELALVDAGVIELMARLRAGEAQAPKFTDLREALAKFQAARNVKSGKQMVTTLATLERLIEAGASSADDRAAMWDLVDRRARLVAVESRRRKDEHEMVSREEFGRFTRATLLAVATQVTDPKVRAKIQEDILRLLTISQGPLITGEIAS